MQWHKLKGYYTLTETAELFGVKMGTFYSWVHIRNRLPKPTRSIKGKRRKYYNAEDIENIKAIIDIVK